jgi:hypothetical protein
MGMNTKRPYFHCSKPHIDTIKRAMKMAHTLSGLSNGLALPIHFIQIHENECTFLTSN